MRIPLRPARLRRLVVVAAALSVLSIPAASAPVVDASGVCGTASLASRTVYFQYNDNIFGFQSGGTETLALHVIGCYTGTRSWGYSVRVTDSNTWWVLGSSSKYPDPTFFTNNLSGFTYFTADPVFKLSAGLDLLAFPSVQLSKGGVWNAYDYSAKVCSESAVLPYSLATNFYLYGNQYYPQLGPLDMADGSAVGSSCAAITIENPVFNQLWFGTYW